MKRTTLPALSSALLDKGRWVLGPKNDRRDLVAVTDQVVAAIEASHPAPPPAVVAISLPLGAEHLAAVLACWTLGYAATLISARATRSEIAKLMAQARPGLVIHSKTDARFGQEGNVTLGSVVLARCGTREATAPGLSRRDALVAFTSGSTGQPKGAVLGADAVLHNVTAVADYLSLGCDDRVLVFTPPHFTYANVQAFSALLAGSSVLLWPHGTTSSSSLTSFADENSATGVSANPSAFQLWMRKQFQLRAMRHVVIAGQPTSARLAQRISSSFPTSRVVIGYGCTENVNRISFMDTGTAEIEGDLLPVGYPIPGVGVEVANDGEILLSGASLMRGYLHDLESSDAQIATFSTGDLGSWTSSGALKLVGRKKTQINVGNEMVSPEEIELVIGALDGIAACAAGGVPDPLLGEAISVLCVLEPWAERDAIASDLHSSTATALSRSKRPSRIHWTQDGSAIPRTDYGKIDRRSLADVLRKLADRGAL